MRYFASGLFFVAGEIRRIPGGVGRDKGMGRCSGACSASTFLALVEPFVRDSAPGDEM